MPTVTVIYVSWNTAEELQRSLRALGAETGFGGRQVVVVDNHSTDGTPQMVAQEFPEVTLIANPDNRGFAAAVNQGWRAATGEYILLLNPDAFVEPPTLQAMVELLEACPQMGACAPLLVDEGGEPTDNARPFPALTQRLDPCLRDRPHGVPLEVPAGSWGTVTRAHWLMGALLLIRRAALEDTSGFDEGFFLYGEDMDWCLRARRAGWEIALLAERRALHLGNRSAAKAPSRLGLWRRYDGYFRFLQRAHGKWFARAVFLWWLARTGLTYLAWGPLALVLPRWRGRWRIQKDRFVFCLTHLGRPFLTAEFGHNHPGR
jgi:GT2 family glycosyltransferase